MKTITTLFGRALAAATLGLATAFMPVAQADILETGDFAAGYQTFGLSTGQSVSTGGFEGEWNDEDIIFWCIQLDEYFNRHSTYTDYVPNAGSLSGMSPTTVTLLGQLFTQRYGSTLVTDVDPDINRSAAFQLAIWEIVYDPTNLNLSNSGGLGGSFYVKSGPADTQALAQTWLNELGGPAASNLIFLQSVGHFGSAQNWVPGHQDFVTYKPPLSQSVPEPHGLALVALAMLAMLGILRMRRGGPAA